MATLPTLYPTGDVSNNGWTDEAGGSTNLFNLVDEVGSFDTDYIRTDLDGCDIGFDVTNMPSDFASMNSLQVEVRHSRGTVEGGSAGAGDDTWQIFAYIVDSTGAVALAGGNSSPANGELVNSSTQGYVPETDTVSFTYVNQTATKAQWDGARLFIEGVFTISGGTDSHRVWVDTVRLVNGDYDAAVPGPIVEGVAETAVSTAGTSHAITLPSGIVATDEVVILMDIGSTAASLNALTDWEELLDENLANGLKILRWKGLGVPSNPTFTSSAATRSASLAYRISGCNKAITPQIGTTATGTSATPNPPSVTPTGGRVKNYLSVAFAGMAGEEADDDTWGNTPPTDYTPSPPRQKSCGTAGTNLGGLILAAERQLVTGSAIDPGTFGVDVSAAWRAQQVLFHPSDVVPTPLRRRPSMTSHLAR